MVHIFCFFPLFLDLHQNYKDNLLFLMKFLKYKVQPKQETFVLLNVQITGLPWEPPNTEINVVRCPSSYWPYIANVVTRDIYFQQQILK